MKALVIAILAVLLVGARCDNKIPGTLDPCGAYRRSCGDSLGGCCAEEDDCVPDGCAYRGRDTTLGAGQDAGSQERRMSPRVRP